MIYRSRNPNSVNRKYYSERGVKVCQRWLESFFNFLEDVGPRPSKEHSLDRYPGKDGDYEPNNVRWATPEQQMWNRRDNRMIMIDGETKCIGEWEKIAGLKPDLIRARLKYGWSGRDLLRPARPWGRNRQQETRQ